MCGGFCQWSVQDEASRSCSLVPCSSLSLCVSRMVGFDELEGGDNFSTASLELMMLQNGTLPSHVSQYVTCP